MVLIVDDEAGIRESLRRFLARRGFEVATAADPAEALVLLELARLEAMILDIRMPDPTGRMRSGLDLLRYIRGQSPLAAVPVIALTGHFLSDEEAAVLRDHHADLLYKPLELQRLADRLVKATGARGG